jgi:hypothetical protein
MINVLKIELKLFLTYSLLVPFGVSLIRLAIPVLDYLVNFDYIAEVLCLKKEVPESSCNGKCYLMQQLGENNTASTKSEIPQTKWEIQLLSLHKQLSYQLLFKNYLTLYLFISPSTSYRENSFPPDTPPPKQNLPYLELDHQVNAFYFISKSTQKYLCLF